MSIEKGTEQGHPLSPDLFKIFLSDLSPLLDQQNCPELSGTIISHLLWADDLVILALDPATLQHQVNILNDYCIKWGIEVNISKTKTMIFNGVFKEQHNIFLGDKQIEIVDTYCYLGFNIHNSGTFTVARLTLRQKAMRSLYGLKNTVNKTKLSHRALCTLFDALIKPIMLYGAPVWCPTISIIRTIGKYTSRLNTGILTHNLIPNLLRNLSRIDCEKIHLHFLKWSMGTHRKSSNVGIWGESGRYPLIYECINMTLKYLKRLSNPEIENTLVGLAFKEQKAYNLDWFRNIEPLLHADSAYTTDHVTLYKESLNTSSLTSSPLRNTTPCNLTFNDERLDIQQTTRPLPSLHYSAFNIMKSLKTHFKENWANEKQNSSKLSFYHDIKSEFTKEPYIDNVVNFYDRASLTKLRISAHELQIEKGRYKNIPRNKRVCKWCLITTGTNTVEDEQHMMHFCDLYANIRQQHIHNIRNLSKDHNTQIDFMDHLQTYSDQINSNHTTVARRHSVTERRETAIDIISEIAKYVSRSLNRAKKLTEKSIISTATPLYAPNANPPNTSITQFNVNSTIATRILSQQI